MDGWQQLGNALGGGIDREGAHAQGMELGARTQNALAHARVRRVEEAAKRDEYENKQTLAESLFKAGLAPDYRTAEGMAGINRAGAGNVQALMSARETGQQMGLADTIMDPTSDIETMQRARLAGGKSTFDPYSMRGGLMYDIFNPGDPQDMYQTPESQAATFQRQQAGELSRDKRLNPGAHRAQTIIGLGDMFGSGSEQPPSTMPPNVDFTQAAGVPGFFRGVGNTLADVIGGGLPFEEAQDAIQALENLATRTQIMMQESVPGRPSQYLMERLGRLALEPGDFRAGSEIGKRKVNQTLALLQGELGRMQRVAQMGVETKGNRDALKSGIASTQQLIADYQSLADSFNRPRGYAPAAPAEDTPDGVDPTAWANMTPEERARVQQILGGAQ
jgi:hypothetical protein